MLNHKVHSVNSINDDVDNNKGKTQEVCKRKDSPMKEILVALKIKLLTTQIVSAVIMIHGTAAGS